MSLNMKSLTQAFAKASAALEKTVQTTVHEVTGLPKPLHDYDLLHQIGSAGPGLVWKLYHAKARSQTSLPSQYSSLCVWIIDKRAVSEVRQKAGLSKAVEDEFLEIVRRDAGKLVRLRHPGVVHVVQALDESKNAMAMVTEPLFASAANALGNVENIDNVPKELKGMEMGLLEVKHGLLQIAETLDFLHNNARLIHRAISPENVLITLNGAWKLGGFGFAISVDQASDPSHLQAFHYAEYDVEDSVLPLQPSLNYTAPEFLRSKTSSVGCSSDVFSFGCLAYHLIAHKRLFDCNNNVKMYMNSLTYLSRETLSAIPSELEPDMQRVLSANETLRPTALDFTSSSFFRDDTRLRALRFLDHMLERDNIQKSEFLKALSEMWKDFDSRILRYKVLPPLCAELRNLVMQPMILPMVLTIAESQDNDDFALSTLPALVPVLNTASGDTLLLLVKHAELVINKASQDHLISHVLPMLVRAYDDNDNRLQEEALKKALPLAKKLDAQLIRQAIVPRVHGLALKTTVAAVRVNALLCLSDMIQMLDKPAVLEILQTIQRCTSVDRSPPTLMCTLGIANSILKRYGIEFVAEHVLPLVIPLLIAQQLNVQQFSKYMAFVKDILRKIEEKRGVTLTDAGVEELKPSPATNGQLPGQAVKTGTSSSTSRRSPSWDEDWIQPKRSSSTSTISSSKPATSNDPHNLASSHSTSNVTSAASGQQQQSSCPAVDVEWPPRSSSLDVTGQPSNAGNSNDNKGSSGASFDDLDPFANWPPRSTGSSNASASFANNGSSPTNGVPSFHDATTLNALNMPTSNSSSWAFSTPSSTEASRQNQGISTLNTGNPTSSIDSFGFLKQSNAYPALPTERATDLGSIFSTFKGDQTAPRIAPPPMAAVGRGRGRGSGNQGQPGGSSGFRSSQAKPRAEQPSLLDLL